jgi:chemotaxis family two-component system response regulator PixG
MGTEQSTISLLGQQLASCAQEQLTGRLDLQATSGNLQWSLYCCQGRLVWGKGGRHPFRRWQRLLAQHGAPIPAPEKIESLASVVEGQEYQLIVEWVRQQKIPGDQAANWIRSTIAELLFEILQQEALETLTYTCDRQDALEASLTLLSTEQILAQAQQSWDAWSAAGLVKLSPSVAPVLKQLEHLQQSVSPQVYQTLVKVIDGQRTLREVSWLMKQDLVVLTRSFIPYIRKGLIEFVTVADLPAPPLKPKTVVAKTPQSQTAVSAEPPLIACIDDSNLERARMELLLKDSGYRFLGIEDPVQALPLLLQHKPQFIFLDLVMPVANGYEVCGQIRKISLFQDIPVVILTGNDGIVDRVRAKLVGATDFLGKPIDEERVLAAIRKYLTTPVPATPHPPAKDA